jgi:hypothetical protein
VLIAIIAALVVVGTFFLLRKPDQDLASGGIVIEKNKKQNKKQKTYESPSLINSCYSWSEHNEVIKKYFPNFYLEKIK